MATVLLAAAGAAVGGAVGGTVLGVSAAMIGQAVGATIGRTIDARLMGGSSSQSVEGPRLEGLDVMTSQEGAPMPYLQGRAPIAGEVIWSTRLHEVANTTTERVGGGKSSSSVTQTEYLYFANFAIGLAEGPVRHFGRIWADGKLLDTSDLTIRYYHGTEDQAPDPLIEEVEGSAPAYLGCAYVVFENFPLAEYGNRVPQIKVEVWGRSGEIEDLIRGVDIIPGSTEFGYMPEVVRKVDRSDAGNVTSEGTENAHRLSGVSDWELSINMLQDTLPAARTAALVVAWFGTDLRAGFCRVEPRVEVGTKDTEPHTWSVAGLDRASATVVSKIDGRPAFGSTPDDLSVVRAIKDLRAREFRVVLYPFIMMDITEAQALPDPSGTGAQGAYPWRGRITPTAGEPVAQHVAAFAGSAAVSDFAVSGESVTYSGPDEWSYRRMILHLAHLGKAAGGVDAILVGSEMRGLSFASDVPGVYPFVDLLRDLAADVSQVIPGALVSYAADWSEYHSHRPGNGDVFFHLDPFWADPNVDFVGIDNYLPLSDWREGSDHLDYDPAKGHTSIYSLDYLKGNIEGGEYFDWFYASDDDRAAQVRTPIEDGAYNERWVFQNKAIRDWHARAHNNRIGGQREVVPTAWVPGSKPIWFTEAGCPAVDKGTNQPNVFWTPASSERALPYFSDGIRDDYMTRQYTRAILEWWAENGGNAVAVADVLFWSWDARPWPEFPGAQGIWSDGPDWRLGHWLNGRTGTAPAGEMIRQRLVEVHGFPAADVDVRDCHGQADGYAVPGPTGFRSYMQPFEVVLKVDTVEDGTDLRFQSRAAALPVARLQPDDMVVADGAGSEFTATRSAAEDVPRVAILRFRDGTHDYEAVATRATIEEGAEVGTAEAETPLVLDFDRANAAAESMIRAASEGREAIIFEVPRARVDIRPGRLVTVDHAPGASRTYMIARVVDGARRAVEAVSWSEGALAPTGGVHRPAFAGITLPSSRVLPAFMDLPILADPGADDWRGYLAAHGQPWPGGAAFLRSPDPGGGFALNTLLGLRATMGETVATLPPDRPDVWSAGPLVVSLYSGGLVGRPAVDVLAGANTLAVEHPGGWEVLQFRDAELTPSGALALTGLLRGQRGTEHLAAAPLPAGALVVVLDRAVAQVDMTPDDIGQTFHWRHGPAGGDEAAFGTATHAFSGIGRRPFAPAHLRALRSGGDLAITWHRRARIEGDSWDTEPPMGEAREVYRVEIGPEGAPVRSFEVTTPAATYTAAAQSADGITAPFEVRVAQVSETFGPGIFAATTAPA